MKKILLIPTMLTITTPLISLVGCGSSDKHEYIDVELKEHGGNEFETDVMTFEEGKYYRFYVDVSQNAVGKMCFGFYNADLTDRKLNVDVIKVVANKKNVSYEENSETDIWYMFFEIDTSTTMVEIYIKVNETKENFKAYLD